MFCVLNASNPEDIHSVVLIGGADFCRGPILEVIVSRMRYISAHTERGVRFVGLSTAVANAQDLAEWLGIGSKVHP